MHAKKLFCDLGVAVNEKQKNNKKNQRKLKKERK
jgi:hypothetical protein